MNAYIQKITINNIETGAILNGTPNTPLNAGQKSIIESHLEQYAMNVLYPNEALNIYKDIHNNTASLVVIRDVNNIPGITVDVP